MCHTWNGKNWDRPATPSDVKIISSFYSELRLTLVSKCFERMTSYGSSIRPLALALLCELVNGHFKNNSDNSDFFMMPFSAMALDGSLVRYQTSIMSECHKAWSSFSMGELSKKSLVGLLSSFGITFMEVHDCGCLTMEIGIEFSNEFIEGYTAINTFRSYAESLGRPVLRINSFEELNVLTDMTPKDKEWHAVKAYQRMEKVLELLTDVPNNDTPENVRQAEARVIQISSSNLVTV